MYKLSKISLAISMFVFMFSASMIDSEIYETQIFITVIVSFITMILSGWMAERSSNGKRNAL